MISFKPTLLLTTLLAASVLLPETEGAAMVISDDRVRSLDISPVLGRGYSIGTNSFQSTCLIVDETTTPSYNYECKYFLLLFSLVVYFSLYNINMIFL